MMVRTPLGRSGERKGGSRRFRDFGLGDLAGQEVFKSETGVQLARSLTTHILKNMEKVLFTKKQQSWLWVYRTL